MDDTERRAIQHDCEQLSIAYARTVDFRDYEAFFDLFTEDAVLETAGRFEGKQVIRERFANRSEELRSRHVLTNIYVDVIDADHARGISYLTLYRHVGPESLTSAPITFDGPSGVGHYEDEFVRTEGGWKFQERKLFFAFRRVPPSGD